MFISTDICKLTFTFVNLSRLYVRENKLLCSSSFCEIVHLHRITKRHFFFKALFFDYSISNFYPRNLLTTG